MSTLTTSGNQSATAYSSQRRTDYASNGVRWGLFWDGTTNSATSMRTRYSLDGGQTWNDPGTESAFGFTGSSPSYTPNASFFIDSDDFAHVAYKDRNSGRLYYRRGTPNAGRTAWTWSAAQSLFPNDAADFPDVVAFRTGTGWTAYAVCSSADYAYRVPITISSGGTITVGSLAVLGSGYGGSSHTYPTINFKHTGDGKTVAGGSPDIYAAWTAHTTGAGKGVRFKKGTYSGGSWTWGAEREIDSSSYVTSPDGIATAFDGSRVSIVYRDGASTSTIKVRVRDAADSTTTTLNPPALSDGTVLSVTASSSAGGLVVGAIGNTSGDPKMVSYDHNTGAWSAWTVLAAATARHLSADRVGLDGRFGFLFTNGTSAPYSVDYAAITINAAPNAPILTAPTDGASIDRTAPNVFALAASDPDPGDSTSQTFWRYRLVGAPAWTTVTKISPVTTYEFPAGTFVAGDHEWQAATRDAQGAPSDDADLTYSTSAFFTAADAPPAPTITTPINGATVENLATVAWSAPTQDAYQVQVRDGSTVVSDTEEVGSTNRSIVQSFPTNDVARTIRVRVRVGGLWSQWYEITVSVSFTPPTAPILSLLTHSDAGSLVVTVTNPAPDVGEPATSYNDIYVTDPGKSEERRATMVAPNTPWTYWQPPSGFDGVTVGSVRVVAVATNGTTASS